MVFRRGQKVELYRKSEDESWETYMDEFVGLHGVPIHDGDGQVTDDLRMARRHVVDFVGIHRGTCLATHSVCLTKSTNSAVMEPSS